MGEPDAHGVKPWVTSVEVVNDSGPKGHGDHWSLIDEDDRPRDHEQVPVMVEVFALYSGHKRQLLSNMDHVTACMGRWRCQL